jgi:hypothetical protein
MSPAISLIDRATSFLKLLVPFLSERLFNKNRIFSGNVRRVRRFALHRV